MKSYALIQEQVNMSLEPANKISALVKRSQLMREIREYFYSKSYIEVDTALLSHRSSIDANIDLIEAFNSSERCFLVSSPEYAIKRLLALGLPNAFQLSHVFRASELSTKHSPEFCMLEWYQHHLPHLNDECNFENLIHQTIEIIALALGPKSTYYYSYWELFEQKLQLNLKAERVKGDAECLRLLQNWLNTHDPSHPLEKSDPLDTWLSYLMSYHIEPLFEPNALHIVKQFPASQAALATTYRQENLEVARRFEIYYGSLELANGYHELTSSHEQLKRLNIEQQERERLGKDPLVIDERFVEAIDHMPSCCGVALGFDRLLMCSLSVQSIDQIVPFSWQDV
jgi:lysyl-tRNA synthetase class 2